MARRELWRTEVDNGICEVICYGCKSKSENLQKCSSKETKENSVF